MADFFTDLGKKLSETADLVGKKTSDMVEIEKLKSQVRTLERANERDYMDIGKMIYEKFQKNEVMETESIEFCESIEKRQTEIESLKKEISRIRG